MNTGQIGAISIVFGIVATGLQQGLPVLVGRWADGGPFARFEIEVLGGLFALGNGLGLLATMIFGGAIGYLVAGSTDLRGKYRNEFGATFVGAAIGGMCLTVVILVQQHARTGGIRAYFATMFRLFTDGTISLYFLHNIVSVALVVSISAIAVVGISSFE